MPESKQLLHFVFGGELKSTGEVEFKDLTKLDFVGMYPNFAEARKAWLAKAQATVDQAQMRYFVVHMHRLMEPDEDHEHLASGLKRLFASGDPPCYIGGAHEFPSPTGPQHPELRRGDPPAAARLCRR